MSSAFFICLLMLIFVILSSLCYTKLDELTLLNTEEYNNIKQDCCNIGQQHFNNYQLPEKLSFSNSIAIFPAGEIRQSIAKE
jgi:hypothetical protein